MEAPPQCKQVAFGARGLWKGGRLRVPLGSEGEVHGRREGGAELKGMRVNENERQERIPGK